MNSGTTTRKVTLRCPECGRLNRVDLSRLADGPKCGGCSKPFTLDRPVKATAADFDKTISSAQVPVLVDFYADWCGPCHMMAPTLEALARDRQGQVLVLKVDTEHDPALASHYGIRGIPTLIAFRDGKESGRHVGVAQRGELERLVNQAT
jgi:thioredoxin 2